MSKSTNILVIASLVVIGIKLFLAFRLELYSDEIFYWQASQFPAAAYSDLPFMSALLAGSGAWLFGNSALAVRSLFLIMGSCLPLLMYWLARPITDQRQALEAAALSFCLPMAAFLGLLAVPDAAMIFWGLLFIGMLERATRTGHARWWIGAGIIAALGLSTHYRFSLYIIAAIIYMSACQVHWHYWRTGKLWLAALIATVGLYPALSFNLLNDLSGIDYHLLSRHPWQFQTEGLLHPLTQSIVVTPLLYLLLWYTLWILLKRAWKGDSHATLAASFAGVNLGVYLLLAPWSDTTRTTLHWPLSGYLPLLIFAPATLRSLRDQLARRWAPTTACRLTAAVPTFGLMGTFLIFIGIGSQGFNHQLQNMLGAGVLSNKMAGWKPMTAHLESLLTDSGLPADSLIVSDNYYTSAQVKFALPSARTFTIDQDKTVRDGRYTQYVLWAKDETGLRQNARGLDAVFVTEDSTLNYDEKLEVMNRACGIFQSLTLIDQLFLYQGDKTFSFYYAKTVQATGEHTQSTQALSENICPRPSLVWLDFPARGETLGNHYQISGWVVNNDFGIDVIRILLNGEVVGETSRTQIREDVVALQNGRVDPDAPSLGFEYLLDTSTLRNGSYQLTIETIARNGQRQLSAERRISIRNP